MSSPAELTRAIKTHALALGFSLVGVTTSHPLPHSEVFAAWLDRGCHGDMAYLATPRSRECRPYPEKVLPGCRSVLVLGQRYPAPLPGAASMPGVLRGKIAAYAWGPDYHDVLPPRLTSLVHFVEALLGRAIPHRLYTDTGPLLERELAQRAGLGWVGKNTCLIHPRLGSYFLLAELLLDLELEPDPPFTPDRCGACTRCLQACPTGCILPDRTLDARRCLSYLTIELKSSIPPDLRPRMGDWIFGCDVCQQVCPWNRFAAESADPAFSPRRAVPAPDLVAELSLSIADFNRKYRRSPLSRPRRRGYLRNVAVALGNSHDPAAVPALSQALSDDPEPLVRLHAAWALGQIDAPLALQALQAASSRESDPQVLREIENAQNHFHEVP